MDRALKTREQVSNIQVVLVYAQISLLRCSVSFSLPSSLVHRPLVMSLCLCCFIICPFSPAINTHCPATITDHLREKLQPIINSVWYSRSNFHHTKAHAPSQPSHEALACNDVSGLVLVTGSSWKKLCVGVCATQTGAVTSWGWLSVWRADNVGPIDTLGRSSWRKNKCKAASVLRRPK